MQSYKPTYILIASLLLFVNAFSQAIITERETVSDLSLTSGEIYVDSNEDILVKKAAEFFQADLEKVTGKKLHIYNHGPATKKTIIIIGTPEKSHWIRKFIEQRKMNIDKIKGKWEAYQIQTLPSTLVITGSDKRGVAYAVFELSKQMGVSPWYWWADVPVKTKPALFLRSRTLITDAPKVKYRGIFINDEAPALSGWSREKFGGFNHRFYEKVFELMLRLKSNYIWPAMWGNAFYDDDSLNIQSAKDYGIVIGTSHHEPLMRAHDEWRRYGKGLWNYDSNANRLREFWRGGMQRASNEKIVSVGMRGDGDEPMTRETATALLERIVKDQRTIIQEVTGKPASETPQLWALYKEVQDYYDKGMRVPDDVTLLLCDDNWGNIRKLPRLDEKPRKGLPAGRQGGYGIYYHFDYVGGPRNYKWLNTNPIARVWEQMHLAWEYKARQIWIVNVGDIKPMEFPISFFLDYAWNPEKIGADDLQQYTTDWCAAQFGSKYASQIADIISKYTKYNGRRKPELLNPETYSMNYNEAERVTKEYKTLWYKAELINAELPEEYKDAYFQLVLYPVKACANLLDMYTTIGKNRFAAKNYWVEANRYADIAKLLYGFDSLITADYHSMANGKWNHMMSQTHIGYTNWQQPPVQTMPWVKYVSADSAVKHDVKLANDISSDGYVSIEADHFTKAVNANGITWKILPDHGRTGSAITPYPVTAKKQKPGGNSAHLQYEIDVKDADSLSILAYFSPTLNFHNNEGLQYAISIDNEQPQTVTLNKEDNDVRTWSGWVANNIIIKTTKHRLSKPGKHIVKFWMISPAVVLQKLVIDFGGLKPSYLGPPETK